MACASASIWNGFCKRGALAEGVRHAALAVAAGEHERHAALHQQFGDRRNRLAVEIDVEDGDVEFDLFGERQSFLDAARFRDDGMAEIAQHAFEQHADHQLVLDHEDTLAAGCLRRGTWLSNIRFRRHFNPVLPHNAGRRLRFHPRTNSYPIHLRCRRGHPAAAISVYAILVWW